jgi:hypothetical protein
MIFSKSWCLPRCLDYDVKGVHGREGWVRGTHMPYFIHDRVWVILGERHRCTFALCRIIRRDTSVRGDLLPWGTERHGVLLDACEELWFASVVTLGNELLERPPDIIEG